MKAKPRVKGLLSVLEEAVVKTTVLDTIFDIPLPHSRTGLFKYPYI
jgi:hypothetical protein